MIKILTAIAVIFILSGCTKKMQTDIKPYVTMNQNAEQKKTVIFTGVSDKRETKIAATIIDDDKTIAQYPLSNDAKIWYKSAIIRELKNTKLYDENNKSNISISINIIKIEATYKKYSLDKKNMKVHLSLELLVTKGDTIVTSNININQTVYKPMILDAEGFESILNESMRDSVSKTVAILIKKLK